VRVRMTLNPYEKRETSKNRILEKTMFKTNTIVKKWFTHKTIIHISITRTEQNQRLQMIRT
jgi:hypothetical protein